MNETSKFGLTRTGMVFIAVVIMLLLFLAVRYFQKRESAPPNGAPFVSTPVDDAFWLNLDRRRSDKYRQQLKAAPQALVVRESHYPFNTTNGMNMHYGWLDGRMADLGISFSELVQDAYGKDYTHTEFPEKWTNGQWTNNYDVICTLTNQPRETFQAAAKQYLKQQYGLSWHLATNDTGVLLIRATDPQLLQSKATRNFAQSESIPELAGDLENYFSKPVIDETRATQRYVKAIGDVPSRWVNGRTTDLDANNKFLAQYGLELVSTNRPQEWLVMDRTN